MQQKRIAKPHGCSLSDKDIQLFRKTYLKLTQLYYQNTNNQNTISDIINLGHLITQVIHNQRQSNVLSLIPITQSLRVRSKSKPDILQHIDQTVNHLRVPTYKELTYETLLNAIQTSDLFSVGCTAGIRFYEAIHINSSEFNWKQIIQELSRNVSINPNLNIELSYLVCKDSQPYCRWAVKSGLIKYVFLSYVGMTLENKFLLYKAIKLIKVVADADGTLVRQKEQPLALVIYTYEDYIPVIEGIIAKCYDNDYCQAIDNKKTYNESNLDQPYLWSYFQLFCLNNLSETTVDQLIKKLKQSLNEKVQTKIYGILGNYSKYKKKVIKQGLQLLPRSEKALLNFIKFCVNCCQIDQSSSSHINMPKLEELVEKSTNQKVSNLFKYLKEVGSKDSKVGVLSENYKKMFDMEKNADFMMERAAKIPQNNEQLNDIKQILKEKDRKNEFESDTLRTVKERALNSLNTAIMQNKKIDLNIILRQIDLGDVKLLAKLLQILELCLTMNEEMIKGIDRKRVLEIIEWIEQNYKGELIEWSSISQLMVLLNLEGEWKKHLQEIPKKCYWLLNLQVVQEEDEDILSKKFAEIEGKLEIYHPKIPFFIGFLSKSLMKEHWWVLCVEEAVLPVG